MIPLLLGYFPKRVTPLPVGMNVSAIEIASVSECIAKGPPNWVDLWTHNNAFFYDSPEIAWKSVPVEDAASYRMYGYKLASAPSGPSHVAPIDTNVTPVDMPASFRRIGYDVANRDYATSFECSPLSCNEMASEVRTNEFCLLDSFEAALAFAQRCAREQPEPGAYVVIEVWRQD